MVTPAQEAGTENKKVGTLTRKVGTTAQEVGTKNAAAMDNPCIFNNCSAQGILHRGSEGVTPFSTIAGVFHAYSFLSDGYVSVRTILSDRCFDQYLRGS